MISIISFLLLILSVCSLTSSNFDNGNASPFEIPSLQLAQKTNSQFYCGPRPEWVNFTTEYHIENHNGPILHDTEVGDYSILDYGKEYVIRYYPPSEYNPSDIESSLYYKCLLKVQHPNAAGNSYFKCNNGHLGNDKGLKCSTKPFFFNNNGAQARSTWIPENCGHIGIKNW